MVDLLTPQFADAVTLHWDTAYAQAYAVDVSAIGAVKLHWETASAKSHRLQVSDNGSDWTDVHSTTSGPGGVETIPVSTDARHVRMYGTQRNTQYGYSLFSFEVYGR
ncbi:discoidin domain-containing protein [Streptomyces sp. MAR4 CNY-716]